LLDGGTKFEEMIWGLIKIALGAMGVLYVVEVLRIHARSDESYRSTFRRARSIHFIERLLIWAGVVLIRILVRLIRPVLDTLAEASADVGERIVARRAASARKPEL